jgi:GNAT superfamily N-acetyltransferase
MVLVRQVNQEDWRVLREIRLAALLDAPDAFASTYAEQAALTEADWQARANDTPRFLAYVPEVSSSEPVGLAGGYQEAPGIIDLISMWVRPRARGHGVGEALVAAVASWGRSIDARSYHLWVTESNSPARRLYERCGFTVTGERQSLPSNPALTEIAMGRPL